MPPLDAAWIRSTAAAQGVAPPEPARAEELAATVSRLLETLDTAQGTPPFAGEPADLLRVLLAHAREDGP